MNSITNPTVLTGESIEHIVKYFDTVFLMNFLRNTQLKKSDFYCGITNDIPANLSRHGIEGYTACVQCSSFEVSSQVEAELGELGFDIGNPKNPAGNGGVEDSTIVYMAYKESGFKR